MEQKDFFSDLPKILRFHIYGFLSAADLSNLCQVSKKIYTETRNFIFSNTSESSIPALYHAIEEQFSSMLFNENEKKEMYERIFKFLAYGYMDDSAFFQLVAEKSFSTKIVELALKYETKLSIDKLKEEKIFKHLSENTKEKLMKKNPNNEKRKSEDNQENNNLPNNQNKKPKTTSEPKIPAKHRRLDSLARLLELDMICAATFYDEKEGTIYVTTNALNLCDDKSYAFSGLSIEEFEQIREIIKKNVEKIAGFDKEFSKKLSEKIEDKMNKKKPDYKKIQLQFDEIKFLKQLLDRVNKKDLTGKLMEKTPDNLNDAKSKNLIDIIEHFQSQDFLDKEKNVPEKSLDVLYMIYITNRKATLQSEIHLANIDEKTAKVMIQSMLEMEQTIHPVNYENAYFEQFLSEEDKKQLQQHRQKNSGKHQSLDSTFFKTPLYPKPINYKMQELRKFCEQVYSIVRDYRKFRQFVLDKENGIKNYRLLKIGDEDSHAEVKMLFFLLGKYEISALNQFYIGISKLCCPHCYNMIVNSTKTITFLTTDDQEKLISSSQGDKKELEKEVIKIAVRGDHGFWKENWVLPIFAKQNMPDKLTEKYTLLKTCLNVNLTIESISFNKAEKLFEFDTYEKKNKEEKKHKKHKEKKLKHDKLPILLLKQGTKKFSCWVPVTNDKNEIVFHQMKEIPDTLVDIFSDLEFPDKDKFSYYSKDKDNSSKKEIIENCLIETELFKKESENYETIGCHGIFDLNTGKFVEEIKGFEMLKKNLEDFEKHHFSKEVTFHYCDIMQKEVIKLPLGEKTDQYASHSTSEIGDSDEEIPSNLLTTEKQLKEKKEPPSSDNQNCNIF